MPGDKKISAAFKQKAAAAAVDEAETTNELSVGSSNSSRSTRSRERSKAVRDQKLRRQFAQEFLDACGDDKEKRKIVQELAKKVLGSDEAFATENDDEDAMDVGDNNVEDDEDEDDSSEDTNRYKWADLESIGEIEQSPYEPGASAEVGLDVFDDVKALLEPQDSSRRNKIPTDKAVQLLGKELAQAMVAAKSHVCLSGIVYSPSWLEGIFRDSRIPGLNKPILLMCLQEHRFSRAESSVLRQLVEDLRLASIVREALDDWDIEEMFPKLANCKETPTPYHRSHKTECQKCEIFVARAYASMNILKRYSIENNVVSKVLACLRIMESHIQFELDAVKTNETAGYPSQIRVPISATRNAAVAARGSENDSDQEMRSSSRSPKARKALHATVSPSKKAPLTPTSVSPPGVQATTKPAAKPKPSSERAKNAHAKQGGKQNGGDAGDSSSDEEAPNHRHAGFNTGMGTAVEQVDLKTGKVLARFPNMSDANLSVGKSKTHPALRDVVAGKRKEASGYFWRRLGSSDLPEGVVASKKDQVPKSISRVGSSEAKEGSGDSNSTPMTPSLKQHGCTAAKEQPAFLTADSAVEKLDMETGDLLDYFPSVRVANESIGRPARANGIREVIYGRLKSSGGFFWRKAGSDVMPEGVQVGDDGLSHSGSSISSDGDDEKVQSLTEEGVLDKTSASSGLGKGQFAPPVTNLPEGSQSASPLGAQVLATASKRPRTESVDEISSKKHKQGQGAEHSKQNCDQVDSRKDQKSSGKMVASKIPYASLRNLLVTNPEPISDPPHANKASGSMITISAMNEIVESPYQSSATAEVGEEIFDSFKALIVPMAAATRRQSGASDIAVEVFGEELARTVIEASCRILVAGVVYSTEWSEGKIRGPLPGPIPKPVLLLLLQEQRLSRPGVIDALTTVVTDFDLCNVLKHALDEWNLADRFWKVSQVMTHTTFTSRKSQCYKCLIFIARSFYCARFLRVETVPESIKRKVDACLHILEANIGQRAPRNSEGSEVLEPEGSTQQEANAQVFGGSDDEASIGGTTSLPGPPKAITASSHVLFQSLGATQTLQKVAAPSVFSHDLLGSLMTKGTIGSPKAHDRQRVATKMAPKAPLFHPNQTGPRATAALMPPPEGVAGKSLEREDNIEWFPRDPNEVILTAIESETAWLVEEGIYCHQKKCVDWNFVWKYASPTLKVELRKTSDGSSDQMTRIVRMHDNIVSQRFTLFRKEIRRKLHRGEYRPRMKDVIPKIRMMVREAERKKIATQTPGPITTTSPSQLERTNPTSFKNITSWHP